MEVGAGRSRYLGVMAENLVRVRWTSVMVLEVLKEGRSPCCCSARSWNLETDMTRGLKAAAAA